MNERVLRRPFGSRNLPKIAVVGISTVALGCNVVLGIPSDETLLLGDSSAGECATGRSCDGAVEASTKDANDDVEAAVDATVADAEPSSQSTNDLSANADATVDAGIDATIGVDTGATSDGSADATLAIDVAADAAIDSAADTAVGADAILDADAATQYGDMTNASLWSTFDTTTVNVGAQGFAGAAFDGRYLYLLPGYDYESQTANGIVARYDTLAPFSDTHSWTIFNLAGLTPDGKTAGFGGAAFDGQYIYFVPSQNNTASHGLVVRYDTHVSFTDVSSYLIFDLTTIRSDAVGYAGASFDGRYVYLVPSYDEQIGLHDGVLARYDTKGTFADAGSWLTFDTSTVNANSVGFGGAAFDGEYIYLVPNHDNGVDYDGLITRYDTRSSSLESSWTTFDTATVNSGATGFAGAAFDGHRVYFVPYGNNSGPGRVARYDIQSDFADAGSWEVFNTTDLPMQPSGFIGGTFDGRYVYLVPTFGGTVVRCDTLATFTDPLSWNVFDTTRVNADAHSYFGAAFDGRYVYFVPMTNGTVARFDAKTPPALPSTPEFLGSFY